MNRLWVRLSLAFAAIIIISFGAISYTARQYFADNNLRSLALSYFSIPAGLIDLGLSLSRLGSWNSRAAELCSQIITEQISMDAIDGFVEQGGVGLQ